MTTNQDIALTYARHGVKVFPCRETNDKGGMAKAPYVQGGLHSASADEGQVRKWWATWPNATIGLPCRANGIVAIDADRHGQEDGVTAFLALSAQHNFDVNSVPSIGTPRDGRHYLFRRPEKLGDTKGKIAPAIDIRDQAYVIAAGSVMANGLFYSLQSGSIEQLAAAIDGATLLVFPTWLSAMAAKPAPKEKVATAAYPATGPGGDLRQRLAGLVRTVAFASPGERNTKLHWAACRLAEIVAAGAIQRATAIAMLLEVGMHAGLSRAEAQATAESGVDNSNVSVGLGN